MVTNGKRFFPNATLRVNKREAKFWLNPENANAATGIIGQHFGEADQCVTPYVTAGKLEIFTDNAAPVPGLGSILYAGHTPDHSAITLESDGQKVVSWGDDILPFDEPGVAIEFDIDQKAAVAACNPAFKQAMKGKYLVAGAHIASPGVGPQV